MQQQSLTSSSSSSSSISPPSTTYRVRIKKVDYKTLNTNELIKNLFSPYNPIKVSICDNLMLGTVFLTFDSLDQAQTCINSINNDESNEMNATMSCESIGPHRGIDALKNMNIANALFGNDGELVGNGNQPDYYAYPPPNQLILDNINKTILAVPEFYTNILHLMNRMNLPPPFTHSFPMTTTSPLERKRKTNTNEMIIEKDMDKNNQNSNNIPAQTTTITSSMEVSSSSSSLSSFNSDEKQGEKKMENSKKKAKQSHHSPSSTTDDKYYSRDGTITLEELIRNRLTLDELENDILKKKLDIGHESNRLYLKNLAKGVTLSDLEFIFGRYFKSKQDMVDNCQITHFTSGRLKNQAFVVFPTQSKSTDALNEVQGYKLKDKPIIIQYGKQQQ